MKGLRFLCILTVLTLVLGLLPGQVQRADAEVKFIGNIFGSTFPPLNFDVYWNQVTPENAGKWKQIEPSHDNMSGLSTLQQMYNYAKDPSRDWTFRQHTFVWGHESGEASWMCDASLDMKAEVREVMSAVCTAMPDIDYIDVVNEPFHDPPCYKNKLGSDANWEWVVWSYQQARELCPNAKLGINEFNMVNEWADDDYLDEYIDLINILDGQGLLDYIGVQGHSLDTTSPALLQSNLNKLADETSADLPIFLTEYDVDLADDNAQLQDYQEQIPIFWNHPRVEGITLWGYVQGTTWRENTWTLSTSGVERPALTWLRETYIDNHPGNYEDLRMYRPPALGASPLPSYLNGGVDNNEYRVMANFYNLQIPEYQPYVDESGNNWVDTLSAQTIRVDLDKGDFDVTEFTGYSYYGREQTWVDPRQWPSSYPAIYKGCHWGKCSRVDGGPLPMRIWDLESLDSEWETSIVAGSWASQSKAAWNAAYDIWLDIGTKPYEEDNMPEIARSLDQPYGTELMIWNDYKNHDEVGDYDIIEPAGDRVASNVSISGIPGTWDLWIGEGSGTDPNSDEEVQWNIVSFVKNNPDGAFDFDAKPFIDYALTLSDDCPIAYDEASQPYSAPGSPCAQDHWWITSAQAGFEMWWNGEGLQSKSFSVRPKTDSLVGKTGRLTSASDPLGQRTKLHWRDHIQLFKMDVTCSSKPTAIYRITGDAYDHTAGAPIPGEVNVVEGDMEIVYDEGNLYDFYAVAEPLRMAVPAENEGIHGNTVVEVEVTCNGATTTDSENVYVDPSGVVRTVEGAPIAGATVTLLRSNSPGGPFNPVPNGSDIMSPTNRTNPDTTDESGSFGWDVKPGYYKVRAEAGMCHAPGNPLQPYVETSVLQVPPPVVDLDLRLECPAPTPPQLPVVVTIFSDWITGYCANVVVTNNTSDPVEWVVNFPVEGSIYDSWNFGYTRSGDVVTAWGVDWNRILQPGQSTHSVGFCANRDSTPPGSFCEVTYSVRNQWNTGFTADIVIKNTGNTPINGWTLTWTFPNGQNIYQAWSSILVSPGPNNASLKNAAWNGVLQPGQTTSNFGGPVGFNANHYGTNGRPTSFTLNGQPCVIK
ncbi:MAG: cellulose binding domain-containing protein [Anaerolineae bacterium]|nr:cellulose binding domain-containing protein [Anaerolineae bacterium]